MASKVDWRQQRSHFCWAFASAANLPACVRTDHPHFRQSRCGGVNEHVNNAGGAARGGEGEGGRGGRKGKRKMSRGKERRGERRLMNEVFAKPL